MKRVLIFAALILLVDLSFAQTDPKPMFVMNGDVIEATIYHNNGAIAQNGVYTRDNKLHGKWMSYDNQGNLLAIAYYDNGKKVGTWSFYQDDIMKEVKFENSEMKEVKTWKNTDIRIVSY